MAQTERRLDGRVALITGAGRGIGRAHALALAGLGAAVVVNDLGVAVDGSGRDPSPAESVVQEITSAGGRAIADTTDVASITGGAAAVAATLAAFGRIDIVVNNAGVARAWADIWEPDDAELDAQLAVHFKAAVGTASAALPHMRAAGYGRIVNTVSEVAVDRRFAGPFAYGAAKAAVWSLTLSTAAAVAGQGITVNAISPAARTRMNAEMLDAGFREGASAGLDLAPEHVARVVAYLASPAAGHITGRIIHAGAGQWREYETRRSGDTTLVRELREALGGREATGR